MRFAVPVLILITAVLVPATAQTPHVNEIHLQLGGPAGSIVSLTYERLLPVSSGVTASLALGAGYSADPRIISSGADVPAPAHYALIPHGGSLIFGPTAATWEIGYGGSLLLKAAGDRGDAVEYPAVRYLFYPFIGCRFSPSSDGSFFYRVRAGLPSTGIYDEETHLFFPPVGFSAAFSF